MSAARTCDCPFPSFHFRWCWYSMSSGAILRMAARRSSTTPGSYSIVVSAPVAPGTNMLTMPSIMPESSMSFSSSMLMSTMSSSPFVEMSSSPANTAGAPLAAEGSCEVRPILTEVLRIPIPRRPARSPCPVRLSGESDIEVVGLDQAVAVVVVVGLGLAVQLERRVHERLFEFNDCGLALVVAREVLGQGAQHHRQAG